MLDRVPETYSPPWVFAGPEFKGAYPLHAFAPGAPMPGAGDQPVLMYLPCQPPTAAVSSLEVSSTFVQEGTCPH